MIYISMFFILNNTVYVTKSLNCSCCCSKGSELISGDILCSFSEFPACSAVMNPIPELFSFFFGDFVTKIFCV